MLFRVVFCFIWVGSLNINSRVVLRLKYRIRLVLVCFGSFGNLGFGFIFLGLFWVSGWEVLEGKGFG